MSEHTYPSAYPPGSHWAITEAWTILDMVAPGIIAEDLRTFLAGTIAGTLVRIASVQQQHKGNAEDACADLRTGHAGTRIDPPWKRYRRTGLSEMRPYVIGEDLTGIWVHPLDTPGAGGMIARNSQDHADQWYVTPHFFRGKMEAVEEEE